MQSRFFLTFFLLFITLSVSAGDRTTRWHEKLEEFSLPNGMRFDLLPWGESPTFSAYIRMRVGGLNEQPGQTGLAHFLEHMAFKGTRRIGTRNYAGEIPIMAAMDRVGQQMAVEIKKGGEADLEKIKAWRAELKKLRQQQAPFLVSEEVSRLLMENGAQDINATTSKDMTTYFVSLPSDRISFWAHIDSQRIFFPVFREFYEEREVIQEERRMRVENSPDGQLYQEMMGHAFVKSPYRWPTIGVSEDLMTLTRPDLERFWKRYYVPGNLRGVVVGNFDVGAMKRALSQTFGQVPAAPVPDEKYPEDPPQTEERRFSLKKKTRERFMMAYHKPTVPADDDYLFDLLNEIIANGRSSRLYKKLVLEEKLASEVASYAGAPGSLLPNLFIFMVTPLPGHSSEEVIKAIDEELAKIQTEGVTDEELQSAKNRILADTVWKMETNDGMAEHLSYFEAIGVSWRYLRDYPKVIAKFKTEDLKKLVARYLVATNRTIGIMRP